MTRVITRHVTSCLQRWASRNPPTASTTSCLLSISSLTGRAFLDGTPYWLRKQLLWHRLSGVTQEHCSTSLSSFPSFHVAFAFNFSHLSTTSCGIQSCVFQKHVLTELAVKAYGVLVSIFCVWGWLIFTMSSSLTLLLFKLGPNWAGMNMGLPACFWHVIPCDGCSNCSY